MAHPSDDRQAVGTPNPTLANDREPAGALAAQVPAASVPAPNGYSLIGSAISEGSIPPKIRNLERASAYRRLLASADLIAAFTSMWLAGLLVATESTSWLMAIGILLIIPINKIMGLYDRDENVLAKTTLDEAPRIFNVATLFALIVFATRDTFFPAEPPVSAKKLVFIVAFTAVVIIAMRLGARRAARAIVPEERLLIVGDLAPSRLLLRELEANPAIRAVVVGRIPIKSDDDSADDQSAVLGSRVDVERVILRERVDRLVVVPGNDDPNEVAEAIRAIKSIGVKISVLPTMLEAVGSSVEPDDLGGVQLMGVKDFRMTSSSRTVKRAMDLAGAAVMLAVAAPCLAVAAIAIKLDSRGPVFYRQLRIGRDGRAFEIVKFRTMHVDADRVKAELAHLNETAGLFKMHDDPRVTRVGRVLRKLSLDELPQVINVLRGDMSLVGPRPLVPEEDQHITGWYRRRSHITPGITGAWQLLGPVRIPLGEMVKIDYLYVANWTLWGDLKILVRTVPHVIARRGL